MWPDKSLGFWLEKNKTKQLCDLRKERTREGGCTLIQLKIEIHDSDDIENLIDTIEILVEMIGLAD